MLLVVVVTGSVVQEEPQEHQDQQKDENSTNKENVEMKVKEELLTKECEPEILPSKKVIK